MVRTGTDWRVTLVLAISVVAVLAAASLIVIKALFVRNPGWKDNRILVMMEIKKHPDRGVLYYYLGAINFKETRYNEAIKCLETALDRKLMMPERAMAYGALGDCYVKKNRIEKAIACYRRAAVAAADSAISVNSLGRVFFNQRDFEKARRYFEWAEAAGPDSGEYARNLANTHLMLGDPEKACAYWRKSLKIDPDQPDIREFLSRYEG